MDIFNTFATDEKLEIEGRWVDFDTQTKFKIARMNNVHYNRVFMRLYKQHKLILDGKGKEAKAKSDEVMAEAFAKAILLDWAGPVSMKGEDLGAYSFEGAKKILMVEAFRVWVGEQAGDFQAFKAVQEEEEEKN